MFLVSCLFTCLIALVLQTSILIGYTWFGKLRHVEEEGYKNYLVTGIRALAFATFSFFGIIFWDTAIKTLFCGVYGYGNIMQFIAASVLPMVLGTIYILGGVFTAPSGKGLLSFFIMVGMFVYTFDYRYSVLLEEEIIWIFVPLFIGLGSLLVFELITKLVSLIGRRKIEDKPLWNIKTKCKVFFSLKLNIIVWALIMAEVALNQSGYSLLVWI
jgi:hypothetical protein